MEEIYENAAILNTLKKLHGLTRPDTEGRIRTFRRPASSKAFSNKSWLSENLITEGGTRLVSLLTLDNGHTSVSGI